MREDNFEEDEILTEEEKEEKISVFGRLKKGLKKTRNSIVNGLDYVFLDYEEINDDFYEELTEVLVAGDLGIENAEALIETLKDRAIEENVTRPSRCRDLLKKIIQEEMSLPKNAYDFEKKPSVIMVTGVNGVGKTTSIGKLASKYRKEGKRVIIAAADTFRAAAIDQLKVWADRANVTLISQTEGSDPSAVVFDAVNAAKARKADILLVDTAGRLHNKKNLMEELRKMDRVIENGFPEAIRENLLVLDATTGQNAIVQAHEFTDVAPLDGVILTKMDGTAKGGMAIAVKKDLGIPVKYIGVGEQVDDLLRFNAKDFTEALFDVDSDE